MKIKAANELFLDQGSKVLGVLDLLWFTMYVSLQRRCKTVNVFIVYCIQGFAFINFVHREDAARAIQSVQGFGYDHLILNVEWAK